MQRGLADDIETQQALMLRAGSLALARDSSGGRVIHVGVCVCVCVCRG